MANCALKASQVSRIALDAGIDMGFNAASVQLEENIREQKTRVIVVWGDEKNLRSRELNSDAEATYEWAVAYDCDTKCIREQKSLEIPESALFESSMEIKARFTGALLELAP